MFVCTGNRARSALGEAFYRRYAIGYNTRARSFGTLDVAGAPALEHAVAAGRTLGVDLTPHTAATLAREALAEADLVLGFERHHVAAAVIDGAAAPRRTFLLREFVELIGSRPAVDGSVQGARAEVAAADQRRAKQPGDASRHLIRDPAGAPLGVMVATATEIDDLVQRLVRGIFGHATRG